MGDDRSPTLTRRMNNPEASATQHRPTNRFTTSEGAPSQDVRRRSSTLSSDFSLEDAQNVLRSSTDNLLLPKGSMAGVRNNGAEPSHWHSAPLAFALLPAIGGMFFKNGSSIITDVMLLGLAAIFLNWSVRLPWDWYCSAQTIRELQEDHPGTAVESGDDSPTCSTSQTSLEDIIEEDQSPTPRPPKRESLLARESAVHELYTHELLALFSCFIAPVIGTYLLHTIRSQLTRPSEGLVSNYNLTIFLLAAELRPLSHLVKLVQSRTLHLQHVVSTNPYKTATSSASTLEELTARLVQLEAVRNEKVANGAIGEAKGGPGLTAKQLNTITTSIRQTLHPDIDALNRAVRRYEKRATLQTMQTESRLFDLESRLADAISLAAAAANSNMHQSRGFSGKFLEWVGMSFLLPFEGLVSLAALPFKTMISVMSFAKSLFIRRRKGKEFSVDPMKLRKVANGSGVLRNGGYGRTSPRSLKRV